MRVIQDRWWRRWGAVIEAQADKPVPKPAQMAYPRRECPPGFLQRKVAEPRVRRIRLHCRIAALSKEKEP